MRYFFALPLLILAVLPPVLAQEPIKLHFSQPIEITRKGNSVHFCAHPANDVESRTVGLMFQEKLPELAGMIFDFQKNDVVHMWMRNTILPLDMIFISEAGKIVKIEKNTTPFSLQIISSDVPARRVLEINAGISDKYLIRVGDNVNAPKTECSLP